MRRFKMIIDHDARVDEEPFRYGKSMSCAKQQGGGRPLPHGT